MDVFLLGSRHGLNSFEQIAILGVLFTAFISLLYAWLLRGTVLKKDKGTQIGIRPASSAIRWAIH